MRAGSKKGLKKVILFVLAGVLLLCAVIGIISAITSGARDARRADVLNNASAGLTDYDLKLILRPEENTLALTETITYTNRTGDVLNEICLRTLVNAFAEEDTSPAAADDRAALCYGDTFSAGSIEPQGVWVNGDLTVVTFTDDARTVLSVPVTLQPGESVTLLLRAAVTIPVCDYRFGRTGDTLLLTSFVPVIPVYEDGAWHTDAYEPVGDPFAQDVANFTFSLNVAGGWHVYANAEVEQTGDQFSGKALAARDLSVIVTRDRAARQGNVNGIQIFALAADEKTAVKGVELAANALKTYGALYGDYPYPVLVVAACPLPFDSAEHPGMILINEELFSNDEKAEQAVAFSCARQWFGAVIGTDLYNQGWMSGALARYAMLSYFGKTDGEGAKEDLIRVMIEPTMREMLNGTYTPGMPVDYFADLTTYISVVYDRGCALMCALDLFLKDGTDAFLRSFAEKYMFLTVTRAEFEQFLNDYAMQDLRPLVVDYLDTQIR